MHMLSASPIVLFFCLITTRSGAQLERYARCRTLKWERAIAYKGGLNKDDQDLLVRLCDQQNKDIMNFTSRATL